MELRPAEVKSNEIKSIETKSNPTGTEIKSTGTKSIETNPNPIETGNKLSKTTFVTWPVKTDKYCEHDSHPFETQPIPAVYGKNEKKGYYLIDGYFCSWGCAKAFLQERGGSKLPLLLLLLKECAVEIFNYTEVI